MKSAGIYMIRHLANGKRYVGSASDCAGRKGTHLYQLRMGRHHSIILQRAWNKYGEDAFVFEIVETVENVALLIEREQFWIDHFGSACPGRGYNVAPKAGSRRGTKQSDEAKAKMAAARERRTPEEKAVIAEKLAAARRGYIHTAETLAKMRGQKRSGDTRRRISVALVGKAKTEEHRARLSAANMGKSRGPQSQSTIAKRVAATRATKLARKVASCR